MARQGYGRHNVIATGPNETSKQVSVNVWNEDLKDYGLLGFTSKEYTIDGSGVVDIDTTATDNEGQSSVLIVESAGGSSVDDDLDQITTAMTNPYDLLYVFAKGIGNTITVRDNTGSGAGKIQVLSTTTLSTTVPLILIRVGTAGGATAGDDWIQYGGGGSVSANDLTGTTLASGVVTTAITTVGTIGSGTWQGTAVADTYLGTGINADKIADASVSSTEFQHLDGVTSDIQGQIDAKQASLTFGIADTNKVQIDGSGTSTGQYSKFTATGVIGASAATQKTDLSLDNVENTALSTWTGSTNIASVGTITTGTWTGTDVAIADGGTGAGTAQTAIDALTAVSAATNEYVLTKDTSTGNALWKASGGADTPWGVVHDFDVYYYDMQVQTKPADPSADNGRFYVKEVDTDNDGVFCIIRKNGAFEETQIV